MPTIFVDADGCPVKSEIYRVAKRYGIKVYLVANTRLNVPPEPLLEVVLVDKQFDAADNWIVDHAAANDIVVSSDIPLAARCLKIDVRVLDPRGYVFSDDSICDALAKRELTAYLRDMGMLTGGPAPFDKQDRSRFLQRLDEIIQAARRATPA